MNSKNNYLLNGILLTGLILALFIVSFKVLHTNGATDFSILNSGFEIVDSVNSNYPAYWEIGGSEEIFNVTLDRTISYTGKASLNIHRSNTSSASENIYIKQDCPVKINQLTKLELYGLIKTKNLKFGWAGFYVSVKDDQGQTIYYNDSQSQFSNGNQDWKEHKLEIILDERATIIRVGLALEGNVDGEVWFDHLQIDNTMSAKKYKSPEVDNYISAFIDTVRKNSINRDSINWQDYERTMYNLAMEASTIKDTYPILRYGLGLLEDGHSSFKTPEERTNWKGETNEEVILLPEIKAKYLGDGIGYINVPTFGSGSKNAATAYADTLHKHFTSLYQQYKVEKWIIDLRDNSGGNMWPMLAGLGPLYDNNKLGEFRGLSKSIPWYYRDGSSLIENEAITTVSDTSHVPNFNNSPVAVLIGSNTASSGEAVAISFIGRPDTKIFGAPTAGKSTANDDFELADGAAIYLTSLVMSDREGTMYGSKIVPDVNVSSTERDRKHTDDVCATAIQWLKEK